MQLIDGPSATNEIPMTFSTNDAPLLHIPLTRPLHVGLNLLFLIPGDTGGRETYTRELVRAMRLERPGVRFTAFVGLEASALKSNTWLQELDTITIPVRTRSRAAWAVAEQLLLPYAAMRAKIDLLHSTANTAPMFGPFRRIVTIHDVLYKVHPELFDWLSRVSTSLILGGAALTAHRLITVSEAARDEIVTLLGVRPDRIDVIPHGFGTPRSGPRTPIIELRALFKFGERPFVLVSAMRVPHKNLPTMIDALALVPKERRPLLVLTGPAGSDDLNLAERIRAHRIEDDVRLLGWLQQCDLEGLFDGAICFALPTLYEGFGLPVLEAMARGVPVACSNIGPLREVADNAALLFDPRNAQSIADSIELLMRSSAERDRLVKAGLIQAAKFTWERASKGTLASYDQVMRLP